MSKGIIRTTPRPTQQIQGELIVTEISEPAWIEHMIPGHMLTFASGSGQVGDVVECEIRSGTECVITSVVGRSVLAQGDVTADQGVLKVTRVGDPNPYNVHLDDTLNFEITGNTELKQGDPVACLPIMNWRCDIIK